MLLLGLAATWFVGSWGTGQKDRTVFHLPSMRNSVGMTLVKVPRGGFNMGTALTATLRGDDERSHYVELTHPFWIGTHEVTRGQYAAVIGGPAPADPELPVTGVTWNQATAFCEALSKAEKLRYRLPTEAEWEYACRAAGGADSWSGTGTPTDLAWTAESSGGKLQPVGKKRPNHWGLFDMHGNAAEWCMDSYNPIYSVTPRDPLCSDPTPDRVVRGGSFARPAIESRSAARAGLWPTKTRPDLGFRVVREDPSPTPAD
jgi:formylglycine-generating enzyme required for sulfatase activity